MAWFKFGKQEAVNLHDDAPVESVEALRNRAKYRLIGSVVLVTAGIIGFPMLFDSQPRTVAIDIPIEIPDKAKTKPIGGNNSGASSAPAPGAVVEDKVSLSGKEEIVATGKAAEKEDKKSVDKENSAQAASKVIAGGAAVAAGAVAAGAAVKANVDKAAAADKAAADKAKAAADKTASDKISADKAKAAEADKARKTADAEKAKTAAEASRAKALLEGQAAQPKTVATAAGTAAAAATPANANPPGTRYIVQFGSYAESAKAQEARVKVEKAGLKTYSQVAKTPEGERIRVRVGPFTSQAEADKAAAKIKALDLPAAILTL